MSFIAKQSGKDFENAPQGMHVAVCVDVVDLGTEISQQYGKEQHKCRIVWQIAELMKDGRPFTVSKKFTVSLGDQSHLKPFLQNWRGQPFTPEELNGGFDLERLVGASGLVQILHEPKKDGSGMWANVSACLPLPSGMQRIQPDGSYTRVKDRPAQPSQTVTPQNYQQPKPSYAPPNFRQPPVTNNSNLMPASPHPVNPPYDDEGDIPF